MTKTKHSLFSRALFLLIFAIAFSASLHGSDELSADQIMEKHAAKQDIDAEVEFVTITTIGGGGGVSRHAILFCTQQDDKGDHQYLVRVISPAKFNGVGLLARTDDKGELERYFYLPALGQVKRVTGSKGEKSPSFLGSNFTYDDLMKEDPELYDYERLKDMKLDGVDCYHIRATLANLDPEIEPHYLYRDIYIEKGSYNIQKINFIGTEDDKPLKTLRAYDYKSTMVDGPTMRPRRAEMRDHESGSMSVLTVMRSRFHEKIDNNYYTPEGLADWDNKQKDMILGTFKVAQKQ